jgi:hypothetical protein
LFSPDSHVAQSPKRQFGESERVDDDLEEEPEPKLNSNVRPSELRASLLAHARKSSAKLQIQMKKRSFELLTNQRQVPASMFALVFILLGIIEIGCTASTPDQKE